MWLDKASLTNVVVDIFRQVTEINEKNEMKLMKKISAYGIPVHCMKHPS